MLREGSEWLDMDAEAVRSPRERRRTADATLLCHPPAQVLHIGDAVMRPLQDALVAK
jgi:hypothetical protein